MNNLLRFFEKHSSWLVFIFYMIMGCVLLFTNSPYQKWVFLTSANAVNSKIYGAISNANSYFNLRDINEDLQERNALLEMEVVELRNKVEEYKMQMPDSTALPEQVRQYSYIVARVINNSVSRPHNYITINRGRVDGIEPDMGVVNHNGIVGKVDVVGEHASRVISLLNPNLRLSCKIKNRDSFGSLVWQGVDAGVAVLEEMPRHVKYHAGDTIVTSGYSSVFPEGIIVGTIISGDQALNNNFITLKVKLSTDFTQLGTVRAIKNTMSGEIKDVEHEETRK